jgi:hypothetical protein
MSETAKAQQFIADNEFQEDLEFKILLDVCDRAQTMSAAMSIVAELVYEKFLCFLKKCLLNRQFLQGFEVAKNWSVLQRSRKSLDLLLWVLSCEVRAALPTKNG